VDVSVGFKVGVVVVVGLEVTVASGDAVSVGCSVGDGAAVVHEDKQSRPMIARMGFFMRLSYIVWTVLYNISFTRIFPDLRNLYIV
jgi:hypothetical protein